MPSIDFSILNRPLPPLSQATLQRVCAWIFEGALSLLPDRWRAVGWRTHRRLVRVVEAQPEVFGAVERSRFGLSRIAHNVDLRSVQCASILVLGENEIFRTWEDFPQEAEREVSAAINLRLDEISPIPVSEACVALGAVDSLGDGRVRTPLVIARRAKIDALLSHCAGLRISSIAALDTNGMPTMLFPVSTRVDGRRTSWATAMSVLVGLLVLAFGLDHHADMNISALERSKTATIALLRQERDAVSWMSELAPNDAWLSPDVAIAQFATALASLPDPVWIEEFNLSSTQMTVRGFVRNNTIKAGASDITLSPSDRPGLAAFEWREPLR